MNKILITIIFVVQSCTATDAGRTLSPDYIKKIGTTIWRNECACSNDGLTSWHTNENFPSFGIGHFIWYAHQDDQIYQQTFPELLQFLQKNQVKLPAWLTQNSNQLCPWKNRKEFYAAFATKKMKELRTLLAATVDLQTQFIIERTTNVLPKLLNACPKEKQKKLQQQFNRLMACPQGAFIIIDYLNFKGEGVNPKERYKDRGWGLMQVLLSLQGNATDSAPQEFVNAATKILTERVANAPVPKNEKVFLKGWINRINRYTQPLA